MCVWGVGLAGFLPFQLDSSSWPQESFKDHGSSPSHFQEEKATERKRKCVEEMHDEQSLSAPVL